MPHESLGHLILFFVSANKFFFNIVDKGVPTKQSPNFEFDFDHWALYVRLATSTVSSVKDPQNTFFHPSQVIHRRACALRALGLLLYSRLPQWEGGRLFDRSAQFFYGNCCNSRTESQKIVPKVGN